MPFTSLGANSPVGLIDGRGSLSGGLEFSSESEGQMSMVPPTQIAVKNKRFKGFFQLLTGRRHVGKSYTLTNLLAIEKHRFENVFKCPGVIYLPGGEQREPEPDEMGAHHYCDHMRIATNYHTAFSDISSQNLVKELTQYPAWGHDLQLGIDELQNIALGRRAMSRDAVNLVTMMTMVRKMRMNGNLSTQFPQVIDFQVLIQIDVISEVVMSADGRYIAMGMWDWWGQWTGNTTWKKWPPPPRSWDWISRINVLNPKRYFNAYNTDERVIQSYADDDIRSAAIEAQKKQLGFSDSLPNADQFMPVTPDDSDTPILTEQMDKAQAEVYYKGLPEREVVVPEDPWRRMLDDMPDGAELRAGWLARAKNINSQIRTIKDFADLLEKDGLRLEKGNAAEGGWRAYK